MNRKTTLPASERQERLRRFHVRHITDPGEIARIQEEHNYLPPSCMEPRFNPNPENWDFS